MFDALIEAQLNGGVVRAVHVVEFDFRSGPRRLWPGFGNLAVNGVTFEGIGNMGRLSPISAGPGGADQVTATLFGEAEILANLASDRLEVIDRLMTVYFQFFDLRQYDEAGRWVDFAPLSDLFTLYVGTMAPPRVTFGPPSDSAPGSRSISVSAINIMKNRQRPAFQFWSDRDQRARSPDDQLFSRISQYAAGQVVWPTF